MRTLLFLPAVLLAAALTSVNAEASEPDDPTNQCVRIDGRGLTNCFQVTDGLYRGGELTHRGVKLLEDRGVRTIVCLRLFAFDKRCLRGTHINFHQIAMTALRPNEDDIVEFLKIALDPNCQPVYVFCNRGAERTGMMCAAYRMVACGWSKEAAICEMTQGPFGYHPIWKQVLVMARNLDVDRVACRVGIEYNDER
jgi:hypothetical protein